MLLPDPPPGAARQGRAACDPRGVATKPTVDVIAVNTDALQFQRPAVAQVDVEFDQVESVELALPELSARCFGMVFPHGRAVLVEREGSSSTRQWPQIGSPRQGGSEEPTTCRRTLTGEDAQSPRFTRIPPPQDVVKLQDRLFYWLQPPLESLLASSSLALPFRPFDYQLDGIAFLYARHEAVLADEMGLGKTMQTVLAARMLIHHGLVRRTLLVCPKPLISNWQDEFSAWGADVPVTVLEGNENRRAWLWKNAVAGVLMVNYELLVRDAAHAAVAAPRFDLVVLDEAQRIKNPASAAHNVVRSIPRVRSWALTGTPIENRTDDLAGIFQFVSPGRIRPQMRLPTLRRAVHDHVLRRTKEQVLDDLPPRMTREAELSLSVEQQFAYSRAEDEGVVYLRELGDHVSVQHVFQLVTRLKQICNFDPETGASAKLERLVADLEECVASGRKAIVFSQWVSTIQQIAAGLSNLNPLEYHGRLTTRAREAVIRRFRDDATANVLLMSYGAGGVGLNLQFASYVFLFDRWWNPAVEDQAINRAHRIGSVAPVTVTRLLTLGTIEERIDALIREKRACFDAVFDGSEAPSSGGLSRGEVLGLFDIAT